LKQGDAKAKKSPITGELVPVVPLPELAKEVFARLGIKTAPSCMEKDYNTGKQPRYQPGE